MSVAPIDDHVTVEPRKQEGRSTEFVVRFPHLDRTHTRRTKELMQAVAQMAQHAAAQGDDRDLAVLLEQIRNLAPVRSSTDARWNELIGPFYDTAGLEKWLGTSRQRLHQRRAAGDLLGVKASGSSSYYYPVWQFTGAGDVIRGVPEVVRGLGNRSAFNKALWLTGPRDEFGGHAAIDVLANGEPGDVRTVIDEARADGQQWRH